VLSRIASKLSRVILMADESTKVRAWDAMAPEGLHQPTLEHFKVIQA
jgi:hypothetical protein